MNYKIWDKQEDIVMPNGVIYTADRWKFMHPVAQREDVKIVCANMIANGSVFEIYEDFKDIYEQMGCDFSDCTTEQEVLDEITRFQNKNIPSEISDETRMADALEDLVVLNMPDLDFDFEEEE